MCLLSSCGDDNDGDLPESSWEENGGNGSSPGSGGNSSGSSESKAQAIIGSWYYVNSSNTHELFVFSENKTADYWLYWILSTTPSTTHRTGTYSIIQDSLYFARSDGKKESYFIKELTSDFLWLVQGKNTDYKLYKTTLKSLESGSKPDYSDEALKLKQYEDPSNARNVVEIIPYWGVDHYTYSLGTSPNGETTKKASGIKELSTPAYELSRGTQYYFTITAYDANGNKFKTKTISFTTGGKKEWSSWFFCRNTYYQVGTIKKYTERQSSSTGKDYKYLRFSNSDDIYVQFICAKYGWQGINSEWPIGTYKIKQNAGMNEYGAYVSVKGVANPIEGKLIIKNPSSNFYTYDFDIENAAGHCEAYE